MKEIVAGEIAKRVKNGDVIGVGTGSTVDIALQKIGARVKQEKLNIHVVPTSYQSAWQCEEIGLNVLYPGFKTTLSWGFDGADAVDEKTLWLIKGKGGAMLQEKILCCRCREFSIIVDDTKMAANIATKCRVPLEVIPEALAIVEREILKFGAKALEVRPATGKHGPIITEAGNIVVDVEFQEIYETLEADISSIVGVVESGLFIGYATEVIVAGKSGVRTLKPPKPPNRLA